jgi:hypothetical protein
LDLLNNLGELRMLLRPFMRIAFAGLNLMRPTEGNLVTVDVGFSAITTEASHRVGRFAVET